MAGLKRTLVIEVMSKNQYLVSIRYQSKNKDKIENRCIIRKVGKKFELVPNNSNLVTFYVPNITVTGLVKDIVFIKAFAKLIKSKAKSISVNYTLTHDDYMEELNEYLNN